MKTALKIIASTGLFVFLVFNPMRANLIASVVNAPGIDEQSQAAILEHASQIDPCSFDILNKEGDTWLSIKNYLMAAMAYGRAMACSPGNSQARFKFGEMLLSLGFPEGIDPVKDSATLEPHNPYYSSETERLTKLLLPSQ